MRFVMRGGRAGSGQPLDIPWWPVDKPLPSYICDTSERPYEHFLRVGADADLNTDFYFAGPCDDIEHGGSRPHVHRDGEL
jgi:hypothetical protein